MPQGGQVLEALLREVRQASTALTRAQDRLEAVRLDLAELRRVLVADAGERTVGIAVRALRDARMIRTRRVREAAAREAAAAEGARLEMQPLPKGGAMVKVGDSRWIKLPARPAHILTVLASSDACADRYPSWLPMDEVADRIGRKTGRSPTRRAIVQAVFRLRTMLGAAGVNPYLLQGDRKRGLRFLLRH
jgi:hypothetical protein